MKILIVNTVPTGFNGITNAIFNLLEALNGKDLIIDFVAIQEPEKKYRDIIEKKWGSFYVFPRNNRPFEYYRKLKKLISSKKYDLVHVHGNSHTMALEMLAAKKAGCHVRIAHGQNSTCYHLTMHKFLTPLFKITCNYGFVVSKGGGDFLFGNMPHIVLYNGIDMGKFAYNEEKRKIIRESLGYDDGCIVIGNVAGMKKEKNQLFLIDVFSKLYEKNRNYRLLLIGDGEDREKIEERIQLLNLVDVIHLTGFADDSIYLSAMDLVIMPSLFEGIPISLIEEQTNGLVCFVSENITKEIDITGKNVFISLDYKPQVWAEIIRSAKIERTKAFADYCYKKIKEAGFDIKDEAEWIMSYYKKIVSENSKGR